MYYKDNGYYNIMIDPDGVRCYGSARRITLLVFSHDGHTNKQHGKYPMEWRVRADVTCATASHPARDHARKK